MKPTIALVGRPNVGKSTLFNRLTRSRDALVADIPGLTRDRHYGHGRLGPAPYLVVDTGGLQPDSPDAIFHEMARQTLQAVDEADAVLLLVDGRAGLTAADREIAAQLRKRGRPLFLVVNKSEGLVDEAAAADFYELGLGEPYPISAAHGDGVRELMDLVLERFRATRPRRSPRRAVQALTPHRDRGTPERRQVDAGQRHHRRRARHRLRPARDHARQHLRGLRARRQVLHADRYRRSATAGTGRGDRGEVFRHQDVAVHRGRQCGDPGVGCPAGHLRAGCAHRRASSWRRGAL